jgi:hypothetical protein
MKAYGGVDVEIHLFMNSALVGGEWSATCPGRFNYGGRAPMPIGWATDPFWTSWRSGKSRQYWDSNSDCLAVNPIASRYTDCAIPASFSNNKFTL